MRATGILIEPHVSAVALRKQWHQRAIRSGDGAFERREQVPQLLRRHVPLAAQAQRLKSVRHARLRHRHARGQDVQRQIEAEQRGEDNRRTLQPLRCMLHVAAALGGSATQTAVLEPRGQVLLRGQHQPAHLQQQPHVRLPLTTLQPLGPRGARSRRRVDSACDCLYDTTSSSSVSRCSSSICG